MRIGVSGPKRSGKSDTAAIVAEHLGFKVRSFAAPLKAGLMAVFGYSLEELHDDRKEDIDPRFGVTKRHIMKTCGTDWGRDMIHPDMWVILQGDPVNVVFDDVRFENEAAFIRERGTLIHVIGRGAWTGEHASEQGVEILEGDLVIRNAGTLDDLRKVTLGVLEHVGM